MASALQDRHGIASRYNFYLPIDDTTLLYNSATGSVLRFVGADARRLAMELCRLFAELTADDVYDELWTMLCKGGHVVASGTDELVEVRQRFHTARRSTPLVLTLTTTMDCNLGCFYCYEERSKDKLTTADISSIVEQTREKLRSHPVKSLHVDWYGGEPLLNLAFLETASVALQTMCDEESVVYHASVISNGTVWPEDLGSFVGKNRIRQVQISFDGLRENHNRRRRFRRGYAAHDDRGSFDIVADVVDRLLDHTRVDLRFNLDSKNCDDLPGFVEFARSRGWFSRKWPAVLQPAKLSAYSERSAFVRPTEMSFSDFDSIREVLRNWLPISQIFGLCCLGALV